MGTCGNGQVDWRRRLLHTHDGKHETKAGVKIVFLWLNQAVFAMGLLRIISGTIEICAGLLMWRLNAIEKALLVNTALAMVGPLVLLTTTTIGLVGIADRLSFAKLVWIGAGVACIFIGIKAK
jgi:hypothetical protein